MTERAESEERRLEDAARAQKDGPERDGREPVAECGGSQAIVKMRPRDEEIVDGQNPQPERNGEP